MNDVLGMPRPMFFHAGVTDIKCEALGQCGSGINIYKQALKPFDLRPIRMVEEVGEYKVMSTDMRFIDRAEHTYSTKIDGDNASRLTKLMDHEQAHFLTFYTKPVDPLKSTSSTVVSNGREITSSTRKDFTRLTRYSDANRSEDLAENWTAFVNYGPEYTNPDMIALFNRQGWVDAAKKAGVIRW